MDISSNKISRLENISHLSRLTEFWASDNNLSVFQEVESELKSISTLQTVYFEGNPLATQSSYRLKIKMTLPQVTQIDALLTQPSSHFQEKKC